MKNVTISISNSLEAFARVLAAEQSKSLSRFIADLLEEIRLNREKRSHAFEAFFKEEAYLDTEGKPFSRDDLYDRKVLR